MWHTGYLDRPSKTLNVSEILEIYKIILQTDHPHLPGLDTRHFTENLNRKKNLAKTCQKTNATSI